MAADTFPLNPMRQYMHQQPPHGPVGPNKSSSAGQRSGVKGLMVSFSCTRRRLQHLRRVFPHRTKGKPWTLPRLRAGAHPQPFFALTLRSREAGPLQ
jgi:hypothetical protein